MGQPRLDLDTGTDALGHLDHRPFCALRRQGQACIEQTHPQPGPALAAAPAVIPSASALSQAAGGHGSRSEACALGALEDRDS